MCVDTEVARYFAGGDVAVTFASSNCDGSAGSSVTFSGTVPDSCDLPSSPDDVGILSCDECDAEGCPINQLDRLVSIAFEGVSDFDVRLDADSGDSTTKNGRQFFATFELPQLLSGCPTPSPTTLAPTASVEPLDCTSVGYYPLQLLKATNDHYYSLMTLTESGVYVTVFNLTYTEVTEINAAAVYEASDGTRYPYAAFDSKLCRFDAYRLDCYEGTMGVEESNAAAIIGNFYYYSNALGSVEGDGLWYASDLDTSPVFHDLTLPVNIDLFSSTIVDFAPVTEDDGTDEYVVDGIEGASYVRARRVFDLESFPSPVTGAPRRSSA